MRDFNEQNLTEAVIEKFAATPDPRLRQVMTSLLTHMHDFVRDVELTFDEWLAAIDFLTRTGQKCDDKRQEFILLSDVLGVSMLVDAINHRVPAGATETTVLGPFFVENAPELPQGADIAPGAAGERLFVEGTVKAPDGAPLSGATIDVWQAGADGLYDVQRPELKDMTLRARLKSDKKGRFNFWTVQPVFYSIPTDGPVGDMLKAAKRHSFRPAHVHFMVSKPGYETLVTHVFADGDKYLDSDAVFGVKNSLVADFSREKPGAEAGGRKMDQPWRRLRYDFGLKPAA